MKLLKYGERDDFSVELPFQYTIRKCQKEDGWCLEVKSIVIV